MAIGYKTHKLGRQLSQLPNMAHITSMVIEKMQFNHFPIISLGDGNQTKWQVTINLAILNFPYPGKICIK